MPTPVPPGNALDPAATALETKLSGFRTALKTQDVTGSLRLQRELLTAANDADLLTHTQVVKTALQTALLRVIDLETGARAFDATGHESSLKPYFDGKETIGKDLQTLRFLTADNPAQQRRLDLLESFQNG